LAFIYQGSTFKNFIYVEWGKNSVNGDYRYTNRYNYPESYPSYRNIAALVDDSNETVIQGRIRPPSECGQQVADCITGFYGGAGWASVGLIFVTLFQPEVGVGVIGECMLACALGY
jgi:hypothetical protein